uniref:Uncharacterized protein n=1 Tax=Trichogramma kaykai TaxID=54128 RepID=A0ABD2VV29_9HYME
MSASNIIEESLYANYIYISWKIFFNDTTRHVLQLDRPLSGCPPLPPPPPSPFPLSSSLRVSIRQFCYSWSRALLRFKYCITTTPPAAAARPRAKTRRWLQVPQRLKMLCESEREPERRDRKAGNEEFSCIIVEK